ncbi:DUF5819 family protein [Streptomyces gilvus]|uniref:DUF5819 family protein n=1 Tax=Streptomyces gilvus TaxID=2920937 RepID=UPI001F0DCF75|nr:DUF5819 family protein [Streptomyces sp. CME 23]MCH5672551.1 DUF5819 family protein [Streptomyces sp. CME 23]
MDAYDTGSGARRVPDGPDGVPEPGEPDGTAEPRPAPPEATAPEQDPAPLASPYAEQDPAPLADPYAEPDPAPRTGPYAEPRTGVAALSPRYQIGAALTLAVVAAVVCVHIGMVFLHVAPSNTLTQRHGKAIDEWIYPEFEQNWKLFAPNPLQQNIAVQARAEVRATDGGVSTTGWYDLSAEDGRAIDGNLLPSHTQQNELRRAWDFFLATHDADNRPSGLRGSLSESYVRRIVALRLDRDDVAGKSGSVIQVQVRSRTTNVLPPKWSGEKLSEQPMYRVLPWWPVSAADTEGGAE